MPRSIGPLCLTLLLTLSACLAGSDDLKPEALEPTAPAVGTPIQTAILLLDADTEAPIPGAELTIYESGETMTADDSGLVTIDASFGQRLRLSARHPRYAATHEVFEQAGWTTYGLYLRARSAESFAQVAASAQEQRVQLGAVTMTFPGGSLDEGTRLDISLASDRTLGLPATPVGVDSLAPLLLDQIRVDLPDQDPWRFHRVIDPTRPVHISYQLGEDDFLAMLLTGPAVYLTTGDDVEYLDPRDIQLDEASRTLSFTVNHFSDVTITQFAKITGGCDGQPLTLYWERLEESPTSLEVLAVDSMARSCADEDRSIELEGTLELGSAMSRSFSGAFGVRSSTSLSVLVGAKGEVKQGIAASNKVLIGGALDTDLGERQSGGESLVFRNSRTFSVAGSALCPPDTSCEAWLEVTRARTRVRFTRRFINLEELLKDRPEFSQLTSDGVRSCVSGDTTPLRRELDLAKVRAYGACVARIINLPEGALEVFDRELNQGGDCSAQEIARLEAYVRNGQNIRDETYELVQTTYEGAEVKLYQGQDASCREGTDALPPLPEVDGGNGQPRRFTDKVSACAQDLTRPAPTLPTLDPLVPALGTFPLDIGALTVKRPEGDIKVTPTLIVEENVTLGPPAEVAFAAACCEQPGTNAVGFTSSVSLTFRDKESRRLARVLRYGGQFKRESELGFSVLGAEVKGVASIDIKSLIGNEQILKSVFGNDRIFALKNPARASATSTADQCQAQGIFARRHRTTMTLTVEVQTDDDTFTQSYIVVADYFGAPLTGPRVTRTGHCADDAPPAGARDQPTPPQRDPGNPSGSGDAPQDNDDSDEPSDDADRTTNGEPVSDDLPECDPFGFDLVFGDSRVCLSGGTLDLLGSAKVSLDTDILTIDVPKGDDWSFQLRSHDHCAMSVVSEADFIDSSREDAPLFGPVTVTSAPETHTLSDAAVDQMSATGEFIVFLMDHCDTRAQGFTGVRLVRSP